MGGVPRDARSGGGSVRWVGVQQFGAPVVPLGLTCDGLAEWVSEWVREIMDRWSAAGCGVWRDTVGAAAMATWRAHSGGVKVCSHDRRDALRLEDRACHGGRASIFTTRPVMREGSWRDLPDAPDISRERGLIRGPVYRLDVRAQYPAIMRDQWFPTRLINVAHGWLPDKLRRAADHFCLIARVTVRSERGELPHRTGERTQYPRGEWSVTLATPELIDAIDRGEVLRVGAVAYYERGRPFEQWGKWILGLRGRAAKRSDQHWASYVKALSVALSGRLASRGGGWIDRPDIPPPCEWGEWHVVSPIDGEERVYRALGGHTQKRERNRYRPGTLGACYAHVTSYGRVQMAHYRAIAGHRQTLSQHTDGLIVTSLGRRALVDAGCVRPGEYGHLQEDGKIRALKLYTPNHLWADGEWTIAGVRNGSRIEPGCVAVDHPVYDPVRQAMDPGSGWVQEHVRRVRLEDIDPGVRVGDDGWVIPPRVGHTQAPDPSAPSLPGSDG